MGVCERTSTSIKRDLYSVSREVNSVNAVWSERKATLLGDRENLTAELAEGTCKSAKCIGLAERRRFDY